MGKTRKKRVRSSVLGARDAIDGALARLYGLSMAAEAFQPEECNALQSLVGATQDKLAEAEALLAGLSQRQAHS